MASDQTAIVQPAAVPALLMSDGAKLEMVRETRVTFGYRAAQQMWFRLGLETVPAMFDPEARPLAAEIDADD